jgi:hypothetical protein
VDGNFGFTDREFKMIREGKLRHLLRFSKPPVLLEAGGGY